MKRLLIFLLVATLTIPSTVTTQAKSLDQIFDELNKTTDKIKDYQNSLNGDKSYDVEDEDYDIVSEDEESYKEEVVSDIPVPEFTEITAGYKSGEYYGFLKEKHKGIGVEFKVCSKSGKEIFSDIAGYTTCTAKNIKPGVYYFTARSRRLDIEDGESVYHYSKWSDKMWFITETKIDTTYAQKNMTMNSVKLKWDSVPGATRYDIYVSTEMDKGYKKVGSTTKTSYKVTKFNGKKLSLKKTKYIKVYPVTKVDGQTVKSPSGDCISAYVVDLFGSK